MHRNSGMMTLSVLFFSLFLHLLYDPLETPGFKLWSVTKHLEKCSQFPSIIREGLKHKMFKYAGFEQEYKEIFLLYIS